MTYCAIDFGTSNSAVALAEDASPRSPDHGSAPAASGIRLAPVEGDNVTLPTAVFFNTDENCREYGRAALAAYIDGFDGRLMRSMKSILGSPLAQTTTDLGDGTSIRYLDVIALFLSHLKLKAEAAAGHALASVVLGRPVFFVDDDPQADRLAENQLKEAARAAGFEHVEFQFEPIAAAFDYESRLTQEKLALVCDLGGGTSDFSLVRVGPERVGRPQRRDDVLAHHGVHVAGTDFDKRVELTSVMRELGYQTLDPMGREVPNRAYFDLSTWHLINTVYGPRRVAELKLMKHVYRDVRHFERLLRTVDRRLGHALAALAEQAKIAVAAHGATTLDLGQVEETLLVPFDHDQLIAAGLDETRRIVAAALRTAELAGVEPAAVGAVYFTGGSTGLKFLSDALAGAFPRAEAVFGDRLASVATGLGLHAARAFG
jgi:hypothetical chaperone protein